MKLAVVPSVGGLLGKREQVFFEPVIKKPVVAHASRDPVS